MAIDLEALYKDLHQHPELSFQEHRTAGIVAEHLAQLGYRVITGIGGTGVVGVLENGAGPVVLLRADMDGLPVLEQTDLPYASTARGVDGAGNEVPLMHACGHDVHVTALLGAAEKLAETTAEWRGTLIALFQPAEEEGGGAAAMVADGLYSQVPTPDVVLGQHVTALPAGVVSVQPGVAMAGADSLTITMFGSGGHGSQPASTVDPVMQVVNTAARLQQIVSREVAATDQVVVTVGQIHSGTKNNIIPDQGTLGLSVRTFDAAVREHVLGAIERIARAEADAVRAPKAPLIVHDDSFPLTYNEPEASAKVAQAIAAVPSVEHVIAPGALMGSEDVGVLATAAGAPLVYWFIGGYEPALFGADYDPQDGWVQNVPSNHSPFFAPVIQPTLQIGVGALVAAAREWLVRT